MLVERSATIDQPVDRVFDYVSTPENDPTWVPASLRHEMLSPAPMRVGVMAAVAAPSALARVHVYYYEIRSPGEIIVVEVICGDPSTFLSKKECEQARGNDPAENVSE